MGVYPKMFFKKMDTSVSEYLAFVKAKSVQYSSSGCHDDGSIAGGLSLTSCVNAKSDPGVVVPFSSKTSIIVWAIEGQAGIQPMPPVGVNKPFTSEQDRGLKKWIDEGAKCN